MLTPDQYPAIFFVALVVTIYFLAGCALVAMVRARVKRTRLPSNRSATYFRRTVLILASIGTACVAYGFVEPYRPEVTRIQLFSPKVADADSPILIVHISDVHSDPRPRLEGRLPAIIAEERVRFFARPEITVYEIRKR